MRTTSKKHLEISLHLQELDELFRFQEINPLQQKELFSNGMNFIFQKIKKNYEFYKANLTIIIPDKKIDPDITKNVKQAITRYCNYKIEEHKKDHRSQIIEIIKTLSQGIIVLTLCLFISSLIEKYEPLSDFWNKLISEGLFIGGWVSLWHPIDLILYENSIERRDLHIYLKIKKMEISVITDNN